MRIPPYLIRAALSVYSDPTARVMAPEGYSDPFRHDHDSSEWGFRLRKRSGSRRPELVITDIVLLALSYEAAQHMLG